MTKNKLLYLRAPDNAFASLHLTLVHLRYFLLYTYMNNQESSLPYVRGAQSYRAGV